MSGKKKNELRKRRAARKKQAPFRPRPLPKAPSRPLPQTKPQPQSKPARTYSVNSYTYTTNKRLKPKTSAINHDKNALLSSDEGTDSSDEESSHSIPKHNKVAKKLTLSAADEYDNIDTIEAVESDDNTINENPDATETDYESSVPPKGYHKGSVIIHDSTDMHNKYKDIKESVINDDDEPYHRNTVVRHDSSDEDIAEHSDVDAMPLDRDEIAQIVEEIHQPSIPIDKANNKPSKIDINDSVSYHIQQVFAHNISPKTYDKHLNNMKKKITGKRHIVTHSMFTTSTPPPDENAFVKSPFHIPQIQKISHQRVGSLPPSKPLPILSPTSSKIKSANNTPANHTPSSPGDLSPFTIDIDSIAIDALPEKCMAPTIAHSQSHEVCQEIKQKLPHKKKQQSQSKTPAAAMKPYPFKMPSIEQSISPVTPENSNNERDYNHIQFQFNPNNPNPLSEFWAHRNMYQSQPNMKALKQNRNVSFNGFKQMPTNTSITPDNKINKQQYKNNAKRISYNDFNSMQQTDKNNKNNKKLKKRINKDFGAGIHSGMHRHHPSNRKRDGNRNAIDRIKQQMAMKIKAKKSTKTAANSTKTALKTPNNNKINAPKSDDINDKELTPEPVQPEPAAKKANNPPTKHKSKQQAAPQRTVQKRKVKNGKRKIRENIFETAASMKLTEQTPKFDPASGSNKPHKSTYKITPKKKAAKPNVTPSELVLNERDTESSEDSDSSSSSSSSSSSVSSAEELKNMKHVKRKSNFRIKTMKHVHSPRFANRNKKRGSSISNSKHSGTGLEIIKANKTSKTAKKSAIERDTTDEKTAFAFGDSEVSQHDDNVASGVYEKTRDSQRTKTPQHMPSTLRRKVDDSVRFNAALMSQSVRNLPGVVKRAAAHTNDATVGTRNKAPSLTYADYKRMRQLEEEKQQKQEFGSSISWICGDVIGVGAFGTVYKGMEKKSGKLMAIKEFKYTFKNREKTLSEFEKETKIMKKLKHVNIVEFYDYKVDENKRLIYLIMEYVPGNSIESIYVNKGAFSEVMIQKYVYQIINGLHYAHSRSIIHRDIKGKNILIDNEGIVKIADFGSAILTEKDNEKDNVIDMDFESTPLWTAPECLTEGKYDLLIDIWSTGCCIIEMATAMRPWNEIDFKSPFQALFHIGNTEDIPVWPKSLSIQCQAFIAKCLIRDPKKRYDTKQLLKHPFLKTNTSNRNSYG